MQLTLHGPLPRSDRLLEPPIPSPFHPGGYQDGASTSRATHDHTNRGASTPRGFLPEASPDDMLTSIGEFLHGKTEVAFLPPRVHEFLDGKNRPPYTVVSNTLLGRHSTPIVSSTDEFLAGKSR